VKAGIGLALVPRAARNLGFEGVVLRPLTMESPAVVELHAIWRPTNANPAIRTLRDTLQQLVDET
jgi:DNA-binding transcriptional LysR family regulator